MASDLHDVIRSSNCSTIPSLGHQAYHAVGISSRSVTTDYGHTSYLRDRVMTSSTEADTFHIPRGPLSCPPVIADNGSVHMSQYKLHGSFYPDSRQITGPGEDQAFRLQPPPKHKLKIKSSASAKSSSSTERHPSLSRNTRSPHELFTANDTPPRRQEEIVPSRTDQSIELSREEVKVESTILGSKRGSSQLDLPSDWSFTLRGTNSSPKKLKKEFKTVSISEIKAQSSFSCQQLHISPQHNTKGKETSNSTAGISYVSGQGNTAIAKRHIYFPDMAPTERVSEGMSPPLTSTHPSRDQVGRSEIPVSLFSSKASAQKKSQLTRPLDQSRWNAEVIGIENARTGSNDAETEKLIERTYFEETNYAPRMLGSTEISKCTAPQKNAVELLFKNRRRSHEPDVFLFPDSTSDGAGTHDEVDGHDSVIEMSNSHSKWAQTLQGQLTGYPPFNFGAQSGITSICCQPHHPHPQRSQSFKSHDIARPAAHTKQPIANTCNSTIPGEAQHKGSNLQFSAGLGHSSVNFRQRQQLDKISGLSRGHECLGDFDLKHPYTTPGLTHFNSKMLDQDTTRGSQGRADLSTPQSPFLACHNETEPSWSRGLMGHKEIKNIVIGDEEILDISEPDDVIHIPDSEAPDTH